jgi:XTP/dITP diphosphohydrolase
MTSTIDHSPSKWRGQQLVIASHNKGKIVEIRDLLTPLGFVVTAASDFALTEPDETEDTFEGNALIKARFVHQQTKQAALADDSGLVIPALDGDPGVHSARWAPLGDFKVAFAKIESRMTPDMDASAYFVCALAFVDADGVETVFKGTCHGRIQLPVKGDKGFGYDPIFVPDNQPQGETRTFGEMAYIEKQKYSHRTYAFEQFKVFLLN